MNQTAYLRQILGELESELVRQQKTLSDFKKGFRKCQADGLKPNPLQSPVDMWESNVSSVEQAIALVRVKLG
jgi:hypothetical protein